MLKNRIFNIMLGVSFLFAAEAFATGFDVSTVQGTKKFELNAGVVSPQIQFVSKAPLEDIKGNVNASQINSWVNLDPNKLESANGKVSFKVKGMETGITRRDGHLASKEWLDADSYPEITFDLQKLANIKVDASSSQGRSVARADALGTISIHGRTKNITVPVTITYIKESDETRKRAPGDLMSVEGMFDVALKDFDVKGTSGLVGSKVGEVINTSFKLFYNSK